MDRKCIVFLCFCLLPVFPGLKAYSDDTVRKETGNRYPIVLVGGFMNFGRDKALGFRYWGGFEDIQEYLKEQGFEVYTADIGPLSSNHDRACELFTEIKGGQVDYGAAHADTFGHERFGKTCSGFYPPWGTEDPETGEIRKVHLVCHSMGGQTGRVLAGLLEYGDSAEQDTEDCSPLFTGGKEWIASITTIATPHDGTTLVRAASYVEDYVVYLLSFLDLTNDLVSGTFFDFQLDHWGLVREEGQSIQDFRDALMESRLWFTTKDFSFHDLTPEGARRLNERTPACKDIYYFSWSTLRTVYNLENSSVHPEIGMNPALIPGALFLASYERENDDPAWITRQWRMSDGVVNTPSMRGPSAGSDDRIVPFNGEAEKGVWNDMGILSSCDHLDIIGITAIPFQTTLEGYSSVEGWYLDLARFLWSLE
ncbi:MAG: triacylglycerol lipase [Spirochaetales bacterium]|nr:triacylglycerol lipase [Spirochaetales bacterium]